MKVKFLPSNIELEIQPGQSVMDLAHKNNIFIKTICNGLPSCAECRVKLVEGESNVMPPTAKELNLIGTGYFIDQRRLSCQLVCYGDVTVDLQEQVVKQNEGPRRVQGVKKGVIEQSSSVTGSLLELDKEMLTQTEKSSIDRSSNQRSGSERPHQNRTHPAKQEVRHQARHEGNKNHQKAKPFRFKPKSGPSEN